MDEARHYRQMRCRVAIGAVGGALLGSACVVWWWTDNLMLLFVSRIGEERAHGADCVSHIENGCKLLTNPGSRGPCQFGRLL
jgi:hypothetical protein